MPRRMTFISATRGGSLTSPCGGRSAGFNDVLMLGALVSFAGAVLALWLVREGEIERQPVESEGEPESDALPEAAAA